MLYRRGKKESERGQILVLFALVLVVILAFASMVVDLGLLRNNRQTLVNAFDSAALAGGTTLPVDGSVAGAAAKTNNLIVSTITANYNGLPSLRLHDQLQVPDRCRHVEPAEAVHLAGHPARLRPALLARSQPTRRG